MTKGFLPGEANVLEADLSGIGKGIGSYFKEKAADTMNLVTMPGRILQGEPFTQQELMSGASGLAGLVTGGGLLASNVKKGAGEALLGMNITAKKAKLFDILGDDGIGIKHPNIQKAVNKYVYDNKKSSIEKALASPDYPAYNDDLQKILKKEYPDGKIPVTRTTNYAEVQALKEKPKKVKTVLDAEDIVFAGNEGERELIANLNGDLMSFSVQKQRGSGAGEALLGMNVRGKD